MADRTDPKQLALAKFAPADVWPSQLDVLLRCATDPPLAIATLVGAIQEALPAGGRVCELGFGSGWLLETLVERMPEAHLLGLDLSAAGIQQVHGKLGATVDLVRGDMERLPFADATLNVVVTCWTLYFMRDIDATLAEMRRCVRPGGRVIAAMVAPDHMREYDELAAVAIQKVLGRTPDPDIAARFDLRSGEPHMRRTFKEVELREWRGELRLPDVGSALAIWPMYGPRLANPDENARVRAEFGARVTEIIARDGVWSITRHDGAFVAKA